MADITHDSSLDNIEWGVTYTDFCQAAIDYYGSTDAFSQALSRGISAKEYANIFLNAGYTVESTLDGTITYIGYNRDVPYKPGSAIEGEINSNAQKGEYSNTIKIDRPVSTKGDNTPEGNVTEGKVKKFTDGKEEVAGAEGATSILKALGNIGKGALSYGVGMNAGKRILQALYDADPDFWDCEGMENIDPSTWGSIAQNIDSPAGRFAFELLTGVRPDTDSSGNTTYKTTAYAQDVAQAYAMMWLAQMGIFNTGETSLDLPTISDATYNVDSWASLSEIYNYTINSVGLNYTYSDGVQEAINSFISQYADYPAIITAYTESGFTGWGAITIEVFDTIKIGDVINGLQKWGDNGYSDGNKHAISLNVYGNFSGGKFKLEKTKIDYSYNQVVYIGENIQYRNKYVSSIGAKIKTESTLPGVENQPDGKVFDISGLPENPTVEDFLKAMQEQYPDLQNNRIEIEVAQPDGSTKTMTYWPLPIGDEYEQTTSQPITSTENPNPQKNPEISPDTSTATQLATIIKILTDPETNPDPVADPDTQGKPKVPTKENPPDTGTGDTPPVVLPVGHASSLWAIYNPTLEQINSFGSWLWSSDFVEQIKKLFNDPMQSIIGLHKVFATPVTGETRTIKVGYLDSGVSSLIVTDQYTTVDCGSVNLFEYFGNVFDYEPYTQLRLYLPFIGIVNLDTADVMRGTIHIVYRVDVLSGACLADVSITRDGSGGVLYQYSGSAAVTMPISSGSYIGIIANVIGIASSAISGFAKGGALGAIAGGASSLLSTSGGANVQHSGNFSGSSGAMGAKKPYIIVERPQTKLARNFEAYIGKPSNENTTLGACTGYVQVKECHLENIPATQQELNNIEQILKGGVLI